LSLAEVRDRVSSGVSSADADTAQADTAHPGAPGPDPDAADPAAPELKARQSKWEKKLENKAREEARVRGVDVVVGQTLNQ